MHSRPVPNVAALLALFALVGAAALLAEKNWRQTQARRQARSKLKLDNLNNCETIQGQNAILEETVVPTPYNIENLDRGRLEHISNITPLHWDPCRAHEKKHFFL